MDVKRLTALIAAVIITLAAVGLTSPFLFENQRLGLDLKGGFEILYEASPIDPTQPITRDALVQTARSLEERANALKVAEPEVAPEGTNRIRVRIAGVTNAEEVRAIMKKPAELTFRGPDGTIELNGSDFKEGAAQVAFSQTNRPEIHIEVKDKEKLRAVSQKLLQQPLAIFLDENMLSAPIVQSVLSDGRATISGNYSYDEAKELAQIINMGALPLKLTEKYTVSVGASLGQMSLQKTMQAAIYGTILILLFMLVVYRVPGMVACVTLIAYTWLLLGTFYLLKATITLPGIAAFVLGIGMAVDANIITNERIKEEIRSGKTILSSLKAGSKNSFRTIMDANITTVVAGVVLYYIGTGAIQGFALTLILSIVLSIATNVFFSRFLMTMLVRSGLFKKPAYYGVKESEISAL
jgi:preprotein translocase subunit SecD